MGISEIHRVLAQSTEPRDGDVETEVAVPARGKFPRCNLRFHNPLQEPWELQLGVAHPDSAACGNCNLELHIQLSKSKRLRAVWVSVLEWRRVTRVGVGCQREPRGLVDAHLDTPAKRSSGLGGPGTHSDHGYPRRTSGHDHEP